MMCIQGTRYNMSYSLKHPWSYFFYSISIFCSCESFLNKQISSGVSGCGVVGRAVASESRDTWIEYSLRQDFFKKITSTRHICLKLNKDWTTFRWFPTDSSVTFQFCKKPSPPWERSWRRRSPSSRTCTDNARATNPSSTSCKMWV